MRLTVRTPTIAWVEGIVDRRVEHASLTYGGKRQVVALVAQDGRHGFTVQFLLKAHQSEARSHKILDVVHRELTFYLLHAVGPDSWAFVQYHCDTPANRLSNVHWTWHPKAETHPPSRDVTPT